MNNQIIGIAAMSVLALATTVLSKVLYREEDKRRTYDPLFKIHSYRLTHIIFAWSVIPCVLLLSSLVIEDKEKETLFIFITGFLWEVYLLYKAITHRKSYYTSDQESLTFIKDGSVAWSYKWIDIDHAYCHIHFGKYQKNRVFFDIMLKDETKQSGLPLFLQRALKEHVPTQSDSWFIPVFLVFMVIGLAVICLLLN